MPEYDVVVVGGGIFGAAVFHELARRGVTRTVLLEKGALASGSTGHSAAMIRVYHSDPFLSDLASESLGHFLNFEQEVGTGCGFVKTGSLYFESVENLPLVYREVERLRQRGHDIRILGRWEGEARCPSLRWPEKAFAVWEAQAGYADPVATTEAWARRARTFGATLLTGTTVRGLVVERGRVLGVETDAGVVRARAVVLAAGVWTRQLAETVGVKLPLEGRWIQFSRFDAGSQCPSHPVFFNRLDSTFGRPEGEHASLIGVAQWEPSGESRTQSPMNPLQARRAESLAGRTVRNFSQWKFTGGVRAADAYAPGRRGLFGRVAAMKGLYLAAGGSGTGFKNAPAIGKRVAEEVLRAV